MAENKITEKTLLPISLVITLISGVVWATVIYAKVETQEKSIDRHEQKIDSVTILLVDIRDRIIRLEEKTPKR